ncbi:unnamed protein product [Closterium sp. NIES-54]
MAARHIPETICTTPFPSLPFRSLPFPSLPFPSLPFPSLPFHQQAKYEAGHMVHELPAVFNLAHQPGDNFYHFLVELLPLFLVSAPLMPSTLRLLPVLLRHKQARWYEQLGAPLLGIQADQTRCEAPLKNPFPCRSLAFRATHVHAAPCRPCHAIPFHSMPCRLIHAMPLTAVLHHTISYHTLLSLPTITSPISLFPHSHPLPRSPTSPIRQHIYQDCDRPSRPLWRLLRRRHLLHPTGLPIFNPDWTYRSHRPLSLSEARAFPPNWVVVLAKRPEGQKRAMLNFREVEGEVVRRFGRERVVVYDGTLPILQGGSF